MTPIESSEPGELRSTTGRMVTLGAPDCGRLMLFFSAGCTFCADILEEAAVITTTSRADVVVVLEDSHGDPDPYPGPAPVIISPEVFRKFQVEETPYVLVMGPGGTILNRATLGGRGELGVLALALQG